MKTLVGLLCAVAVLLGCTPPAPSPVGPPDVLVLDAAPYDGGGSTPCQLACARLQREGCPTLTDCPTVYGDIERDRLIKTPTGVPLTCAAVVNARALTDLGLRCP